MEKALNVFVVETRFQALVALLIAAQHPHQSSLVFYYLEPIGNFLARFDFVKAYYLNPTPTGIFFKSERRIRRMLNTVYRHIKTYDHTHAIHFHCAKLQGSLFNFYVNFLRTKLHNQKITFNIISDGTFNFKRRNVTDADRCSMLNKARKKSYRLFGLHYYIYDHERYGIEADIIDKIYLLPKSPHEYDPTRVVDIPLSQLITRQLSPNTTRRALVIGEKLTDKKFISLGDERVISSHIVNVLKNRGITHVDYVKHPTATHADLYEPWYTSVHTHNPVEIQMLENDYAIIVGIASTALFTAKLLCGDNGQTISVGLDKCLGRDNLATHIKQAFIGMGVELIAV